MSGAGYSVASVENDERKALAAWHKLGRYEVPRKPRQVLTACGFDPLGHEAGLMNLQDAVERGDELSVYMTSRNADVTNKDGLLDHWDIRHLHLGTELDLQTGRIKRTRHILLCRIDYDCAYFLKVVPHGPSSPAPWYEQNLIDIIHRNWPWSIERARLRGVNGISHKHDDDDTKQLRDANVVAIVQVDDGTVYMPPGMGTTGDGTHIDDLMFSNRVSRTVARVEKHVVENYTAIADNAKRLGYHFKEPVSFVLWEARFGAHWDILEPQTNYRFRIQESDV